MVDCVDKLPVSSCLKLRLHTAINRADFVSWCMLYIYIYTKVTKCIREKMTMCFREWIHIHQDAKSARFIAVCKRSFRMVGMRNIQYWFTGKIILMLSVYWFLRYICKTTFFTLMGSTEPLKNPKLAPYFTLSNARRFFSSREKLCDWEGKG